MIKGKFNIILSNLYKYATAKISDARLIELCYKT